MHICIGVHLLNQYYSKNLHIRLTLKHKKKELLKHRMTILLLVYTTMLSPGRTPTFETKHKII